MQFRQLLATVASALPFQRFSIDRPFSMLTEV